jgi:hypothetical protein
MFAEILGALGRAVELDDEPALRLLSALGSLIEFDRGVGAGVMRVGERAFELGHDNALARITHAVSFGDEADPGAPHVPSHWIRRLVGTATPEEVRPGVLSAVSAWLSDGRSDVETVRDMIADPQAWIDLAIARS